MGGEEGNRERDWERERKIKGGREGGRAFCLQKANKINRIFIKETQKPPNIREDGK